MKPPSLDDHVVAVTAYLTDESFGYEHWRAAQYSAPRCDRHGALVLFATPEARDAFLQTLGSAPRGTPEER